MALLASAAAAAGFAHAASTVARLGRSIRWIALALPLASAIDGQSHKASDEEIDRVWNDPNCDRTRGSDSVDWANVRDVLLGTPFPYSMPTIVAAMQELERPSILDREALLCPFGVITVLFFFVKSLIEGDKPNMGLARSYFSVLDGYASGMHPNLIARSDWPAVDSRVTALRHALLNRLRKTRPLQESRSARPLLVYVYDKETPEVRELSQGASFCGKGQWGMEVQIHEWLIASHHRTRDPEEADFFFVPGYAICMFEGGILSMEQLDEKYLSLVQGLPYFSRNKGRDHIFTFGSGMSTNVFRSWRETISDSIFLTPETWLFNDFPHITEPCFNTWKDIAIPGYMHRHEILSLASNARQLAEREHLAVFFGRVDASRGPHPSAGGDEPDPRGALRQLHAEGKIFVAHNLSIQEMYATMGNARFCFVPKGKSAWSLRLYEALFAGCVPIVLSDHWELPFEDFLDLPRFVVKWPMDAVGDELLETLRQLPDEVVERYMQNIRKNRCWYVYPPVLGEIHLDRATDPLYKLCPNLDEANAFVGITRLLVKKRRVARSAGRFFTPPRGDASSPAIAE